MLNVRVEESGRARLIENKNSGRKCADVNGLLGVVIPD